MTKIPHNFVRISQNFVWISHNFVKKMQMFVWKMHNFDKNKNTKMDKNTPKQKRSPKRKNPIFQWKNRGITTQKHNPTDDDNKITLKILFYYIVAIQKRKKHKIKKYTIIIYNNRNYIKQSHTTPHNDTNNHTPMKTPKTEET